ncbi:hypothetical protein SteCoe_18690 [Stentor coeruleus]|uniref:Uncharacterized protein n=1 Tax=Stentor coeruleus TaxID=5963 RepID=A0A1R2BVT1_9CILI|nr:hypothetical protein SteCoe_18690 [Stentor coeruleus]
MTSDNSFPKKPEKRSQSRMDVEIYRYLENYDKDPMNTSHLYTQKANYNKNDDIILPRLCTSKVKLKQKREARIAQGLSPEPDSLSDRNIGLSYEACPKIKTKTELKDYRKLADFPNNYSDLFLNKHITAESRLNIREEHYRVFSPTGKTLTQLLQERKEKFINYNSKVFGKVMFGIHKKELPKFQNYKKDYWNDHCDIENEKNDYQSSISIGEDRNRKTQSVDVTCKPNEISPCYREGESRQNKYHRKYHISKIEVLVNECLKTCNPTVEIEDNKRKQRILKKKLKANPEEEIGLKYPISLKHFRSKGFK